MALYKIIGVGEHGKFFDDGAYETVLNYIFHPQKAVCIGGVGITSTATAAEEMRQVAIAFGKDFGKRLRHSVLTFEPQECVNPEQANNYAQRIIQYYTPEYQITYAVHGDTDHVHVHFVMNQISFVDGHRYAGKKKDYYGFRKYVQEVTHLPVKLVKSGDVEDENVM